VAERSIAVDCKSIALRATGVRIPPYAPIFMKKFLENQYVYFGIVTIAIFTILYIAAYFLGFAPKSFYQGNDVPVFSLNDQIKKSLNIQDINNLQIDNSDSFVDGNVNANVNVPTTLTSPDRISISKIGVDAIIQKPQSQIVSVLDQALNLGPVYYPGSGHIEQGNVLIFGHSTNWQIVQNQAYKTFNNLNKLTNGDEIILSAGDKKFIYKVEKVFRSDENNTEIFFNTNRRVLTIATCDSFGKKQDRWVVEAVFDREV
jgi:LPXTG-site transpeptidase (sortase) family protein